ncbi:hypothetical protein QMI71_003221 [Salmonella enterica]|nr:hypothetical protein [Salmonella enterica]
MTLYGMEGFLRGKCVPGDMKVNESNAQYLVRKFSELQSQNADMAVQFANAESKCRQLAAENAGLKDLAMGWANATDDRLFEEHGEIFHDSIEACEEELKTICPTTDAILAEVRVQALEQFAVQQESISEKYPAGSYGQESAYDAAQCAREFAEQLRQEAAQ